MRLPGVDLQMLAGERVLVAVSGGADSTALALLLADTRRGPGRPVTLAGLVHVNHELRGEESDADEAFCRALASRLGVSIHVSHAPVTVRPGRSPEAAARHLRDRAFHEAAAVLGATRIATAHTLDDQVETVLLRLLRGSGLRGVAGIRAQRGIVVRPLLTCRRAHLRAWLDSRGEAWREDRSNDDLSIPRNRVRHHVLPVLEAVARDIAPAGLEAVGRFAALADDDEQALEAWTSLFAAQGGTVELDGTAALNRAVLHTTPRAIARRLIRRTLAMVAPGHAWSIGHVDAILHLSQRPEGGGILHVPGVVVERVDDWIRFTPATSDRVVPVGPFEYQLDVPGRIAVPEAGIELAAGPWASDVAVAAGDVLLHDPGSTLTVRNRRPGDSVRTVSGHHRKLQDLMVDAKIPRLDRDRMPLVVAPDGQILWAQGLAWGRPRPERASNGMVVLKVRKLETT